MSLQALLHFIIQISIVRILQTDQTCAHAHYFLLFLIVFTEFQNHLLDGEFWRIFYASVNLNKKRNVCNCHRVTYCLNEFVVIFINIYN